MMKTIVALVLASSASAFKPSKAFLGIGGLASAAKYDPKIFEDASAAKDAFPIEQGGERRLNAFTARCVDGIYEGDFNEFSAEVREMGGSIQSLSDQWELSEQKCKCSFQKEHRYILNGVCTACPIDNVCDGSTATSINSAEGTCDHDWCATSHDDHGMGWFGQCAIYPERCSGCEECKCDADRERRYMLNGVCTACPIDNLCDGFSTWSAAPMAAPASGCDDACKPGGTYTGPGDPAGCTATYCDLYAPGGYFHTRCDPTNYLHHYALEECAKTCDICPGSSGNSRSRTGSLTIIIPVVIAAVLLLAAVLYLVRKRRVAAATPDETPQLDTEVQVEA